MERVAILKALRAGEFDVLVGINLLREGLDLPEVSLVAILDADKEGFLRSPRALIQTVGRAARNINGRVFMYGDRITNAMNMAISETNRRRIIQAAYNEKHGITPTSTTRTISDLSAAGGEADYYAIPKGKPGEQKSVGKSKKDGKSRTAEDAGRRNVQLAASNGVAVVQEFILPEDLAEQVEALRSEMFTAAENLEFETAARLRDQLNRLTSGTSSREGELANARPSEAPGAPEAVGDDEQDQAAARSSSRKPTQKPRKKSGTVRKPGASDAPESASKGG
jgi:excinuclease ABC subunit B